LLFVKNRSQKYKINTKVKVLFLTNSMKKIPKIFLIIISLIFYQFKSSGQIDVIKDLAEGAGSLLGDVSASDLEACCVASDCCWDGGIFFVDFLINHHEEIMDFRYMNPTLLSLEIDGSFTYAIHYGYGNYYTYINYLPRVRGNLGVFAADFRYNILTEYTDDFPNAFKSWELLFLINLMPDENVKFSIGSGVFYEEYTEKYYNENYFETKFGIFENKNFLGLDTRVVYDYNTARYPFFEAGIYYNTRIIEFEHLYGYITLGGIYQNYYQAHDIWAARGGFIFNLH
jgi:hypothetical protein